MAELRGSRLYMTAWAAETHADTNQAATKTVTASDSNENVVSGETGSIITPESTDNDPPRRALGFLRRRAGGISSYVGAKVYDLAVCAGRPYRRTKQDPNPPRDGAISYTPHGRPSRKIETDLAFAAGVAP